jgi:hypothetical protein
MAGTGLQANSEGLANAITVFWLQLAKGIALQTAGMMIGAEDFVGAVNWCTKFQHSFIE